MSDGSTPRGMIKPQVLTSTALDNTSTALVDDPVALVDDPNVLTGSQTTAIGVFRVKATTNAPRTTTKQRR